MTSSSGKYLERLVAAIHHAESTGATVTWNDVIDGRQFDVTLRFTFGLQTYLTVIECKDYSSKVPAEKVDALVTKARDVKANKAVMISTHGFQSGCSPIAERHGIQLFVLTEASDTLTADLVAKITPGLNIFDVSFDLASAPGSIELEDWGGQLAYLMNHARVILPTGTKTPNQLVHEWQLTMPALDLDSENQVELRLPPGSQLEVPLEPSAPVSKMRFACALVDVHISKEPLPDNHVLAGMSKRVELRDVDGNLHHTARLSEIPLGFDAVVTPDKFYEIPAMFNRYICDKVEGDLVTWTLLESYQHGNLFQGTFTQKLKHTSHYVEVTDAKIIHRLQAMLAKLRSRS